MNKHRVFVVRCPDYSRAREKTAELLERLGGLEALISPGESVLIKPNLLRASPPEKAVTTHPAVLEAVAAKVRSAGAEPGIADSPGAGYPYTEKRLDRTYRTCGITQAAASAGVPLNTDTTSTAISFPQGRLIRRFEILTPVAEADAVFNLCKLKTHSFTAMTGAVKNLFGVVPGRTKIGYHASLQDPDRFAGMLLDLAALIKPRLSILDAVTGMEGDGPAAGRPRKVGLLLAAFDPLALDVAAAEIMGLPPDLNPLLREAARRGLSPIRIEDIELVGLAPEELRVPGFRLPSTLGAKSSIARLPGWIRRPAGRILRKGAALTPRINRKRCIACGVCRDACPAHVIRIIKDRYASIDERGCIHCYCCHEMCPRDAVELRSGFLHFLFNR